MSSARICQVGLVWLAWVWPMLGFGAVHRIDDSMTYTEPPVLQMQWREWSSARQDALHVEAWLKVHVRLDTRPWQGRSGRIYMRLDRDDDGRMEASWQSQGRLRDGRLRLGERTLVYAGPITAATMTDTLTMRLQSTPDWSRQQRRMIFSFEFETDNAP